jgi:ubiquinone/menaquinone biosynthesis C-methylase UbiE
MNDISNTSLDASEHDGYVINAENAAEMARLMLQDRLLTKAMGGVLPERHDIALMNRVLDIACGPGGWLLDLVTQYPHIQGFGVDISHLMMEYASTLAISQQITNVQFQVMDITQLLQFPESSFDLINGRLMTGFLFTHQWPTLIQACKRILKPGGILRFTEAEWGYTNSLAFDTLQGKLGSIALHKAGHSFSPNGRTVGTTNVLRLLLRKAGFEDIQYKAHAIDYSTGTEYHDSNIQNMLVFHKLYQPFLAQMQVATMEELQRLYEQFEQEVQEEDFCAVDYFLTVWGTKDNTITTIQDSTETTDKVR